ncbi:hypothetical protein JRO89_XS08G0083000 [Xanthoceras sorbifolium]|uniref:Histone deacetylase n=1 Tax=Xanthoceras sorbifolium TaxID=99658 RepID=A0ABQ8HP08_9ROSI|nr:hypothetical protein JRO89_XS08G0083000 [Xanthoceras sorbifolium]
MELQTFGSQCFSVGFLHIKLAENDSVGYTNQYKFDFVLAGHGNVLSLMRHNVYKWKKHDWLDLNPKFLGRRRFLKHPTSRRKNFSKSSRGSLLCSYSGHKIQNLQLSDARVIFSVAPAMGHNQESHPESHFRVPAIMSSLEKMELTSKFRGSEIIELQNFKPASVDDIASVHAKAYVSGLEKAMDQASQQGIILIEGSGPTYATPTVRI